MNLAEHPTPKRETPDRLASKKGDGKLDGSKLPHAGPTVNPPFDLPPHNIEAEKALIGACLVDPTVAGTLDSRHFYNSKLGLIARILRTKARDGVVPDRLSLKTILESKEEFNGIDIYQLLLECDGLCHSPAHSPAWIKELKRLSRSRSLCFAMTRAAKRSLEDPDAAESDLRDFLTKIEDQGSSDKPKEWFTFHTPGECRDFQPPVGFMLVGD